MKIDTLKKAYLSHCYVIEFRSKNKNKKQKAEAMNGYSYLNEGSL